jgi:lambda repressor-like predicted transcriptional regulator
MKKKKTPLLPTIIICRFEKRCGTFRGKGRKNPMSLTTLSQFAQKKIEQINFF